MGHLPDGRVVFVPFTAPGDRVRVRIDEDHRRFARASLETLISEGPARCEPLCPVFGSCGGCAWQHIRYPDQLAAKRKILADALTRIGRFALAELPAIQPSPQPYHYRARTRVLGGRGLLGYRRRRSHRLCAIRSCPVLLPPVDAMLSRLAEAPETWMAGVSEIPGRPQEMGSPDQAPDQEWELAGGSDGGTHRWRIPAETPPASSSSRANAGRERDRVSDSAVAAGSVAGLAKLTIRLEGDSLQISPGVFMQANALLWQPLVDAVVHAASHGEPGSRLIELHSGAGFFTLALARRFSHVVAIESNGRAVADLRANLAAAGIANVLTIEAPVEDALRGGLAKPDCVVLDPPRSGLSADAVEGLVALDPRRIVYLSCDPATLARDLRLLCEAIPAYRLTHASAFDLFPQTPHIEGLAVLEQQ